MDDRKTGGNRRLQAKDERISDMFARGALRSGVVVLGCAALIVVLGGCPQTSAPTMSSTDPADGAITLANESHM
jgi:hypothetical protein